MADQNWLQGVMDWYQTNVAPVMNTVRDYMAEIDPEGAQQANTLSEMRKGEIPAPTFDDGTDQITTVGSVDPMNFVNKNSGISPRGEIPVEEMVSPAGKGKAIGKALKYGVGAAALAYPALSSIFGGKGEATDHQTVNPNLLQIVKPTSAASTPADKAAEEQAARQEIEAATSAIKDGPKEETFDVEAIAKKYGNPQGGGYVGQDTGSVFTEKEIAKEDLGGLKNTGYVEKDGKKVYIYSRPEKKTEAAAAETPASSDPQIISDTIKRLGYDPRTLNPMEEAKKAVEQEQDAYFTKIFGGGVHPNYMTQQQRDKWNQAIEALYQQKVKEFAHRQESGYKYLTDVINQHVKKPLHVKEGDRVVGYNKTTGQYEDILSGGPKAGKPLSTDQAKQIDKILDGMFMDRVDERKTAMNNGKVYESLPKDTRDEYDALREKVTRIMMDSTRSGKPLTVYEASKMARADKGSGTGKALDRTTAASILKEAKGDKGRARQIAKERGYSLS